MSSLRRSWPTLVSGTLLVLLAVAPASAQITPPDADFDALAQGPWFDPLFSGSPDNMGIFTVANAQTLYPLVVPPGATGNLLRVDNSFSDQNADVILRFAYDCGGASQTAACRLSFGYVAWSFFDGRGVEVHIDDDGSYSSPVSTWSASIGAGEVEDGYQASEFHDVTNCSASHLLEFVVHGGALLILDGVTAQCLEPVSVHHEEFGTVKSRFD